MTTEDAALPNGLGLEASFAVMLGAFAGGEALRSLDLAFLTSVASSALAAGLLALVAMKGLERIVPVQAALAIVAVALILMDQWAQSGLPDHVGAALTSGAVAIVGAALCVALVRLIRRFRPAA